MPKEGKRKAQNFCQNYIIIQIWMHFWQIHYPKGHWGEPKWDGWPSGLVTRGYQFQSLAATPSADVITFGEVARWPW